MVLEGLLKAAVIGWSWTKSDGTLYERSLPLEGGGDIGAADERPNRWSVRHSMVERNELHRVSIIKGISKELLDLGSRLHLGE